MVIYPKRRYIFQPYLHPLVVQGHIYIAFFVVPFQSALVLSSIYFNGTILLSLLHQQRRYFHSNFLEVFWHKIQPLICLFTHVFMAHSYHSYSPLTVALLPSYAVYYVLQLATFFGVFYGVILSHTLAIFWAPFSDTYWCLLSLYINGISPSAMALIGHLFCP